jgi:hypothetical protein
LVQGTNNLFYGVPLPHAVSAVLKHSISDVPPLFLSPGISFELSSGSPAIGAGTNTGLAFDLVGTPRARSGKSDVGAYQHLPPTPVAR